MIRFLVARYYPNQGADMFVNIGVLAQDGEKLIAKFCSDANDLSACPNVDLTSIPLNVGEVFAKNLKSPLKRLDYATMKEVEIKFGSPEYFQFIRSSSYASHLRYSDIYQFDIPKLSELVVEILYELFVIKQHDNPFSTTTWSSRKNEKVKWMDDYVAVI